MIFLTPNLRQHDKSKHYKLSHNTVEKEVPGDGETEQVSPDSAQPQGRLNKYSFG